MSVPLPLNDRNRLWKTEELPGESKRGENPHVQTPRMGHTAAGGRRTRTSFLRNLVNGAVSCPSSFFRVPGFPVYLVVGI